jgi:hypothetical protein
MDLDGSLPDVSGLNVRGFGDTGLLVLISDITEAPGAFRPEPAQTLRIACTKGCSLASLGHISKGCDKDIFDGNLFPNPPHHTGVVNFAYVRPGFWDITVDATGLDLMENYKLCVDLDGAGTELGFVDTGRKIYNTPISAASYTGQVVSKELNQTVQFKCTFGCDGLMEAHLVPFSVTGFYLSSGL